MAERPLIELNPRWWPSESERRGVTFDCPACALEHGDRLHKIIVPWDPPSPHRGQLWARTGDSFDVLTLSPSIDCSQGGGCAFHGFVTGGKVTW